MNSLTLPLKQSHIPYFYRSNPNQDHISPRSATHQQLGNPNNPNLPYLRAKYKRVSTQSEAQPRNNQLRIISRIERGQHKFEFLTIDILSLSLLHQLLYIMAVTLESAFR
jgi:hypothetical protein